MCQRIGFPPIGTIGFGIDSVYSASLVPNPPASKPHKVIFLAKISFFTIDIYENKKIRAKNKPPHCSLLGFKLFSGSQYQSSEKYKKGNFLLAGLNGSFSIYIPRYKKKIDTNRINKIIIDPIYDTSTKDLKRSDKINVAFVCVPTPMGNDGSIDSTIIESVIKDLAKLKCPIVIKSTITPHVIKKLTKVTNNIVYNPEFLTERNALEEFVNPPMHILGGESKNTSLVYQIYENHSLCKPCPVYYMSAVEASFVKYGINSFLATKVLWFNQFKDLVDAEKGRFNIISSAIGSDPRIGHSHTQVPGPDGRKGFGGACFPKDTRSLLSEEHGDLLTLLNNAVRYNSIIRKENIDD